MENKPIRILGIAGSLRRESYNRAALRAATKLASEGVSVGISMVLQGWSYVMFAIALRNWSVPVEVRRAA